MGVREEHYDRNPSARPGLVMTPYQEYIANLAKLVRQARTLPLGGLAASRNQPAQPGAPKALIFSPHPDDEVIIGALPLRLMRELRWSVINVAVTQGSHKARQAERLKELRACCEYIGFGLIQSGENGLEGINPESRLANPAAWNHSVARIAEILLEQKPRVVFFPHDDDWNVTHVGTHHLVADALRKLGAGFSCTAVETEFWGAMDTPNLMVESNEKDVADLITGISFHVGEVKRNPYHVILPAWLMDNVRRGGELVGGQGQAAPDFLFGTIYRLRRWHGTEFTPAWEGGRFLSTAESPARLFD
jgi:LmbE family N-acetylglucosaminyl deacetylase